MGTAPGGSSKYPLWLSACRSFQKLLHLEGILRLLFQPSELSQALHYAFAHVLQGRADLQSPGDLTWLLPESIKLAAACTGLALGNPRL